MGLPPSEVGRMSLWEYGVCIDAWNDSHNQDGSPPAMTDERFDQMVAESERLG